MNAQWQNDKNSVIVWILMDLPVSHVVIPLHSENWTEARLYITRIYITNQIALSIRKIAIRNFPQIVQPYCITIPALKLPVLRLLCYISCFIFPALQFPCLISQYHRSSIIFTALYLFASFLLWDSWITAPSSWFLFQIFKINKIK